jgi:hypothetical protein
LRVTSDGTSGFQVQLASNLTGAVWQTIRTFSTNTNQIMFTTNIPPHSASNIFRVQ